MYTYTRGIPNPPNNPSTDVPDMQINTDSIDSALAVDHVPFNVNYTGYHEVIHLFTQLTTPVTTLFGELYGQSVTPTGGIADTELFFQSANGVITQLTGANSPSVLPNGYTWIGSILLQWGTYAPSGGIGSGSTTSSQNFNIPFPNGSFIVTGNPTVSFSNLPSSTASLNIRQSTLGNKTAFSWQFYTNSSNYLGFTWFAIGY
jgi:hypothetical protein